MPIHHMTTKLGTLTPVILALLLIGGGCRNKYWRTDEQGKLISPIHDSCSFRSTEFERSLCEAEGDAYAVAKVRLCVKKALIEDLAKRQGPASEPALVLRQLDSCDVTRDSVRVRQLIDRGMLELDYGWDKDSITAMDQEITERAESMIRFACYNPNNPRHFDELGTLIVRNGPCQLESWTETTLTVSFKDGTTLFLTEDAYGDRWIRATAPSYEQLKRDLTPTGDTGDTARAIRSPEMRTALHQTYVDERREIDIPVDYIPLDFAGVYCHVLPSDSLGRPLNAQAVGSAAPRWDYRCAYLDCFVNLDEFADGHGKAPDSLIMDIEYAIERSPADGAPLVSEKLPFRLPWPGMGNEGLIFRICTKPIRSYADDTTNYELSVRADNQGRTMIHKFPFRVAPADYELVTAQNGGDKNTAFPVCERKATAKIGFKVNLLVPLVDIPASGETGGHCCRLDLYLIPEKAPRPGSVTVSRSYPLRDSTVIPPELVGMPDRQAISPYMISSREICLSQTNAYSGQTVNIPRQYPGGGKIKRGNYLLGGYVSVDGKYHSQVLMTRITLE
jgi:hypothetical protein